MDNRLTKKRLSDLLSYEWIIMIIVCIVSIVFWELMYDVGSVKLTAGQDFKFFYDYTISPSANGDLRRQLSEKNTYSYDVLKISSEAINKDNNVLYNRLSIREGDVIFSDIVGLDDYNASLEKGETPKNRLRAYSLIDTIEYKIGAIDVMLDNAKEYLKSNFFVDGYDETSDGYGTENIDDAKVRKVFISRNGKDNRFRSAEAVNQGVKLEKDRIVKLCENVKFMQEFFDNPENEDSFVRYTKYSQTCEFTKNATSTTYKDLLQMEKTAGRENRIYAINLGKLKGGKNITNFMQYGEDDKITDIIIMSFDFTSYQPHLQYENLSFISSMIKICTGA